jgi:PAS domain-containing protein
MRRRVSRAETEQLLAAIASILIGVDAGNRVTRWNGAAAEIFGLDAGEAVRVHLTLRPNDARKACWSDEDKTLRVWVSLPPGWRAQPPLFIAAPTDRPDRAQPQHVECDIGTPTDANGTSRLLACALYEVCHGEDGTSRLLRQDIPIMITVDK